MPFPITITTSASVLLVAFFLTQTSTIKEDAKQVAELQCKTEYLMKLDKKSVTDIESVQRMTQYTISLSNEMSKTYTTPMERSVYLNAYSEALNDCRHLSK